MMMGYPGPNPNPKPSFWSEPCPARPGGDLLHKHNGECEDGHPRDVCCDCLKSSLDWLPPEARAPLPPIDVQGRLRDLGLIPPSPSPWELPDRAPEESDDDIHGGVYDEFVDEDAEVNIAEPKMVTGELSGPEWGIGRSWRGDGELSPRDKARLGHIVFWEKRNGYR